jgi:hypothetical protein
MHEPPLEGQDALYCLQRHAMALRSNSSPRPQRVPASSSAMTLRAGNPCRYVQSRVGQPVEGTRIARALESGEIHPAYAHVKLTRPVETSGPQSFFADRKDSNADVDSIGDCWTRNVRNIRNGNAFARVARAATLPEKGRLVASRGRKARITRNLDSRAAERRDDVFTQIGTTGPDVKTYTDSNAAAAQAYCYRVGARNAAGIAYCDPKDGTPPLAIPAAPSGLGVTALP